MNEENHTMEGKPSMNKALKEGYLGTVSGGKIYPSDSERSAPAFDIDEIARVLSHQCRFGGHLTEFFSVAQHSLNCLRLAREENATYGEQLSVLMHDAHEAYLCDVPTPIKMIFGSYYEVEKDWEVTMARHFSIPDNAEFVKKIDVKSLFQEANQLQPGNGWSERDAGVVPESITNLCPIDAANFFVEEFHVLYAACKYPVTD